MPLTLLLELLVALTKKRSVLPIGTKPCDVVTLSSSTPEPSLCHGGRDGECESESQPASQRASERASEHRTKASCWPLRLEEPRAQAECSRDPSRRSLPACVCVCVCVCACVCACE